MIYYFCFTFKANNEITQTLWIRYVLLKTLILVYLNFVCFLNLLLNV